MNVFEINNAIAEIENKDLDPEVLVDTIKSLELTRDQKLDGAAGLSDKYDSEIQWATDRIKELREFIKVSKNKKDRLNTTFLSLEIIVIQSLWKKLRNYQLIM